MQKKCFKRCRKFSLKDAKNCRKMQRFASKKSKNSKKDAKIRLQKILIIKVQSFFQPHFIFCKDFRVQTFIFASFFFRIIFFFLFLFYFRTANKKVNFLNILLILFAYFKYKVHEIRRKLFFS